MHPFCGCSFASPCTMSHSERTHIVQFAAAIVKISIDTSKNSTWKILNWNKKQKTHTPPFLSMFRLGYQLAIYPATGFLAMGQALNKVYRNLSETGDLEFQPTDHGILVMIQWVVWRKWEEDLQCWLICFKWLIFMKFLLGYFGGKRGVSNIFVAGVLESDGGCWYIGILPTLFWFNDVFFDWCNTYCFHALLHQDW